MSNSTSTSNAREFLVLTERGNLTLLTFPAPTLENAR